MKNYYYAIDGDDIGKSLEQYVLENNIPAIEILSNNVKESLSNIETFLCSYGAKTIFCAGDSILAYSSTLINLPNKILFYKNISFSAGIGDSPSLALLALKKAKGLGKKRIEIFIGSPT
jgi:GTP cyclohydrolase III